MASSVTRDEAMDSGRMVLQFEHACARTGLLAAAPVLGLVLLAAALVAPLAIGGWNFSTEALVPDFGRLDPIAGFGRVFSMRGVIELLKALARFVVVGAGRGARAARGSSTAFTALGIEPVRAATGHALAMCGTALIALGGALGAIALIDVPLALWQHHKSLRMSREEIREENKDAEGSPEIKSRVRACAAGAGAPPHDAGGAEGRRRGRRTRPTTPWRCATTSSACAPRSWSPRAAT